MIFYSSETFFLTILGKHLTNVPKKRQKEITYFLSWFPSAFCYLWNHKQFNKKYKHSRRHKKDNKNF